MIKYTTGGGVPECVGQSGTDPTRMYIHVGTPRTRNVGGVFSATSSTDHRQSSDSFRFGPWVLTVGPVETKYNILTGRYGPRGDVNSLYV